MLKAIYIFLAIAIIAGIARSFISPEVSAPGNDQVVCPKDAMQCPDGSSVGRTGPNCEFVCPPASSVPVDVQASLDAKADLIVPLAPAPNAVISSPLEISGKARGGWFFEASFPVILTNWDGLIIAEGVATAGGEWMTSEFVPFSASLTFISPYKDGDPDFMKSGVLIFKKDNPSGLPEHDDALEIPVRFAL